jgi:serine/threonine protein kinase
VRQPVPFGKYLLLDRISVGGMAEVFKAKSYGVEGFEKIIAIKRILPTMGEDRDFIKMFIDEAKIAGQLAHANICQIFELGRIDGSHFIAMEYIWGKDLLQIQNRLRKIKQPMPIAMACFSIAKVLEGLDYAHRKRDPLGRPLEIVHRDCSPQNVLVSYEGEVKVIDFGIAKATSRNSRTMAGVLKGKFGYMSPEQVRGLPLDRRSDIFALGTMLYECLTGDRLFQGETDFSTLEKVRNVDVRPPRELNPNIPVAVEAVILKALAKDVDERYQWCSEMLADLQAFLMSQDVVFTAKSLSSWIKEVFQSEIDRERQQLEQYKRVGRDGLIAGVPAAESKLDVVENLGEAGPVEGDPTVLGGPNFDEMEPPAVAAVAPEVGPAPGSPAARGGPLDDDDDSEDFGEEAPTEIFGEIDHGVNPAAPPASSSSRAPTLAPANRPPKLPARPPTGRDAPAGPPLPGVAPMVPPGPPARPPGPDLGFAPVPPTPPPPGFSVQSYANPANAGAPYQHYGQPPAPGYPPQHPGQTPHQGQPVYPPPGPNTAPVALGTPGAMPVPHQPSPTPGQGRTLIGGTMPAGLPNYSPNYPPQFSQYPDSQYPDQYPGQNGMPGPGPGPGQGPGPGPGPGMAPYQPYPQATGPYGQPGHPGPTGPYGVGVPPVEGLQPEVKKKSSIARDVAIGVAIAALVLAGFLAVKYLILDNNETAATEPSTPPGAIATIRLAMTGGINAELFVDDKKVATVSDKQEIQVTAGTRKVRLSAPSGAHCEQSMTLAPGKVTTLECALSAGSGAGSAQPTPGSAAATGSAAAGSAAAGSAAAGSAAAGSAQGSAAAPVPVPDKTDKMPVEDKAKAADAHPADKTAAKPPDKVADKAPDKPADKAPDKALDKVADKSHPVAKPADDDLGKLQGGTKPGDKYADPRKTATATDDSVLKQQPRAVATAADAKGYLIAISKPNASVWIDGADTGLSTPVTGKVLPLSPGKHKITFVIKGDKFTFTVDIKPGIATTLQKDLQ